MRFASFVVSALALAGCLRSTSHTCADQGECPGGVCVTSEAACAFADPGCPSGLRFGDATGAVAGQCVGGGGDPDAGPGDDGGGDGARPDGPSGLHDEDGDGVADGIDNCPHLANPGQSDVAETAVGAAADGVGDACDPDPTLAGNTIVLFDPMTSLSTSRWNATGASADADAVRLGADGSLVSAQSQAGRLAVTAQVRMVAPAAGVVTLASYYVSVNSSITCLRTTFEPAMLSVRGPGATASTSATAVSAGTPLVIRNVTDSNRWACTTTVAGQNASTSVDLAPFGGGRVAIATTGSAALVDYLIIISRP